MILVALLLSAAAPADLIIRDAHIVTVDPKFSTAQAAAIRDGRFIAVGSDADVMKSAGPKTRIVDLHGKTVLPGFNDTHVHLTAGEDLPTQVDLTHIRSIKDIQAAIAARAAKSKPGNWIVGTRGWWEYQLAEGRLPTRADLDAAAPNNPVAIPGPHYVIVNSRALALAHVTRDTPPTFLLQAQTDSVDNVNQSLAYYVALRQAGVPTELHLYYNGGHAFGLRRTKDPITEWPRLVERWLATIGVISH